MSTLSEKAIQFAEAVRRLNKQRVTLLVGTVQKVTGKVCRVTPIDGGADYTNVRLSPIVDESAEGYFMEPEEGSDVLINLVHLNATDTIAYVVACSKIKSLRWITSNGTVYSMTNTEELITQLNKNNQILSAILGVINSVVPITEPGNGASSALQIKLKEAVAGKQLADFTNIKNERIKHA